MKIRLRNDRNYNSKGKVQCTECMDLYDSSRPCIRMITYIPSFLTSVLMSLRKIDIPIDDRKFQESKDSG